MKYIIGARDKTPRMRETGKGSAFFGPCEVCGNGAATVYLLVYRLDGEPGTRDVFGHRGCLESIVYPEHPRSQKT